MADMSQPVSLTLGVAFPSVAAEVGHGRLIRLTDADWTTSNLRTTATWRGWILDSVQGAEDWRTTTSGDYARRRLSTDWTQTDGDWSEVEINAAGDYWTLLEGTSGTLTTAGSDWTGGEDGNLRANPHIHLSAYVYGAHDDASECLRLVWGDGKWRLRVYGNGAASLDRDFGSGLETVKTGQLFPRGSIAQGPIRFRVVPCFRRCVYLWGMGGSEICYEDYGLDPSEGDWTDTAAESPLIASGPLTVTAYRRVALQVTEVVYLESGTAETIVELPYAPTVDAQYVSLDGATPLHWQDRPSDTSITIEAPDWTPDGSSTQMPLRATLTRSTDKYSTPTLCGVGIRFDPQLAQLAANEAAITGNVRAETLVLDVGEERSTLSFALRGSTYAGVLNRPASLRLGSEEIWAGVTRGPTRIEGAAEVTEYEAGDWWDRAERTQMPIDIDYSGCWVHDAVHRAFLCLGLPESRIAVQTGYAALPPRVQNDQDGEAQPLTPAIGTTIADWLRYLWSYEPEAFCGFEPVGGVMCGVWRYALLETAPAVALYRTQADAYAALSLTTELWRQYVVTEMRETRLEPEATRVTVIGQAPGGLALVSQYADYWAEAVTPPTPTPANWVGEIWERVIQDPELTTLTACGLRARREADKLTRAYAEAEVRCGFHPQLRRGSVVRLYDVGATSYTDWRVKSYRVAFDWDAEQAGNRWRDMQLVLRRKL